MSTINAIIEKIEILTGGFKPGSMYAVCSKPGKGKTQLCIDSIIHLADNNKKILYMSDSMDIDAFYSNLTQSTTNIKKEYISFKECYYVTIDKLKEYHSKLPFDFLILDPFDIYSYDLDIGELKEFAKSRNVGIFLTKTILRSPENEKRDHLVLSDIKFSEEKTLMKFIAYSDIIMFLYHKESDKKRYISFGKNLHSNFFDELEYIN